MAIAFARARYLSRASGGNAVRVDHRRAVRVNDFDTAGIGV